MAQPGDELIGQWQGQAQQRDAEAQQRAKAKDRNPQAKGQRRTAEGRVVPASNASGTDDSKSTSSSSSPDDVSAFETVQPPSLLDQFDFKIDLHFRDRQNVEMTFVTADRRESLRGTWRVTGQSGDKLTIEISPTQPKANAAKGTTAADASKGKKSAPRRFQIELAPKDDDRFTLTEVDTGRQQGSIVFRRQEAK